MIKSLGLQRLDERRSYGASLRMAGRHKSGVRNKLAEEDGEIPKGKTATGQTPTAVNTNPTQQNLQMRAPEGPKPTVSAKV